MRHRNWTEGTRKRVIRRGSRVASIDREILICADPPCVLVWVIILCTCSVLSAIYETRRSAVTRRSEAFFLAAVDRKDCASVPRYVGSIFARINQPNPRICDDGRASDAIINRRKRKKLLLRA